MGELFFTFLRLGCTSFGGPFAHLGYFRHEFVVRKRWLDERTYGDIVALCQALPGPASSQVGMTIGLLRSGLKGAFLAWLGFTLPSAVILILCAMGLQSSQFDSQTGWLNGIKLVPIAVIAQACLAMTQAFCPDLKSRGLAGVACVLLIFFPQATTQMVVIFGGALLGGFFLKSEKRLPDFSQDLKKKMSYLVSIFSLSLFFLVLTILPWIAQVSQNPSIRVVDRFYRAGALVFGGGHVVLPLLQTAVVTPGWVHQDSFMIGYGLAQAVPGPLFTFSAYLGSLLPFFPFSWMGGIICLISIFLPSFLIVVGILPFWGVIRKHTFFQNSMSGINTVVVGLLLSALIHSISEGSISSNTDILIVLFDFGLLKFFQMPSWAVVLFSILVGRFF